MRVGTILAVAFLAASGCGRARSGAPYHDLDQILLVQPPNLFGGGWSVLVKSDGTGFARIVDPPVVGETGLQERWYAVTLPRDRMTHLISLLDQHDFFSIEVDDRAGVPDETRPELTVRLKNGKSRTVAKWGNDRHADFDTIQNWLIAAGEESSKSRSLSQGPYERGWWPDGFMR